MRVLMLILATLCLSGCQLIIVEAGVENEPEPELAEIFDTTPVSPLIGSEDIGFMDHASSRLNGCRPLSRLQLSAYGRFEDAMTLLRNRAQMLNANMMVPIRIQQTGSARSDGPHIMIAQLVRCPDGASKTVLGTEPGEGSLQNG